jgi:hypothetical protein
MSAGDVKIRCALSVECHICEEYYNLDTSIQKPIFPVCDSCKKALKELIKKNSEAEGGKE